MPRPLALMFAALVAAAPAARAESFDALLAEARRASPEIQAAALDADAARARVEGAASLMDPMVRLSVENWGRSEPGYLPQGSTEGTMKKLIVSQQLPFWGKREMKRGIADAEARQAAFTAEQTANDLAMRLKVALAELRGAEESLALARKLEARLGAIGAAARVRYAQGEGQQPEVTQVAVERAAITAEIARMEARRAAAEARVNRLLARPQGRRLAEVPDWRRVPDPERHDLAALIDRAQRDNPDLKAERAMQEGANRAADLARRNWYPDVEVGVGAVREMGRVQSYEAMVAFSVPLQWGLRRAEIGSASAAAAAARNRREAGELKVAEAVAAAWADLAAARAVEAVVAETQLPQAELGFESAIRGYQHGRVGATDVLMAERQMWTSGLDLVAARMQQQARLAELEALIGDDL